MEPEQDEDILPQVPPLPQIPRAEPFVYVPEYFQSKIYKSIVKYL